MGVVSTGHLQRIDILRGFAIASVILFHFYGEAFGTFRPEFKGLWIDPYARSLSWWLFYPLGVGWAGVCLFFVISGYVIHRSQLRDQNFTWSEYASRRFWRIYPAYFVALVAFSLWQGSLLTKSFGAHALLLHNMSDNTLFSINPSFWSLAVEVQLYALYPLALYVQRRAGLNGMLAFGCAASAMVLLLAYSFVGVPPAGWFIWYSAIALWPSWLLGAMLAQYHQSQQRLFRHPLSWALITGVLVVIGSFSRLTLPLTFLLASVTSAALMEAFLFSARSSKEAWLKPLAWLGLCSYSVYLIHQPLLAPFMSLLRSLSLEDPSLQIFVGAPVFIVLIFGAGWLMYSVVERGSMRAGRAIDLRIREWAREAAH